MRIDTRTYTDKRAVAQAFHFLHLRILREGLSAALEKHQSHLASFTQHFSRASWELALTCAHRWRGARFPTARRVSRRRRRPAGGTKPAGGTGMRRRSALARRASGATASSARECTHCRSLMATNEAAGGACPCTTSGELSAPARLCASFLIKTPSPWAVPRVYSTDYRYIRISTAVCE